jgi:phenylacetate-CoA ligase
MSEIQISVVAPCFNEEHNVAILASRLVSAATTHAISIEVIFIDDGSLDETWKELLLVQQRFPKQVVLVKHVRNQGIATSWRSGIASARGQVICFIDSDLQNRPESVVDLYRIYTLSNVDLVRGVRVPVGKQNFLRKLMSRVLNVILNLAFSMNSRDNKSGFVLGSRICIERITQFSGDYRHYQTFLGVAAHSKNFQVIEIDTPFDERVFGKSFLLGNTFRTVFMTLRDISVARQEFRKAPRGLRWR